MVVLKFNEGGWITIFITGLLVVLAIVVKRHYKQTLMQLRRLNDLIEVADTSMKEYKVRLASGKLQATDFDSKAKTAIIMVGGYNGLGLHTLFNVIRLFGDNFKNFFFVRVGVIDTGNFKGAQEIDKLEADVKSELNRYCLFMQSQGFYAEGVSAIGIDVVEEAAAAAKRIFKLHPRSVFFGGQMVFEKETTFSRMLHNHTTFAIQKELYRQGIPFLIMPIRISSA
jgi:hypothetical protein